MKETSAVSKARQRTQKGHIAKPDFGFEQRHETSAEHYRTVLFTGQCQLGFVSLEVEAKVGARKSAFGYLTLNPAQAKAFANALNQFADAALEDRNNPEFQRSIEELPDNPLS